MEVVQKRDLIHLIHMPQWSVSQPPMGIAYVGSYLKSKGFKVRMSDYSIDLFTHLPEEKKIFLDSGPFHMNWLTQEKYDEVVSSTVDPFYKKWLEDVLLKKPAVVGFSVLTTNIIASVKLAKMIKQKDPSIKILFGGPYSTRYDGAPYLQSLDLVDFIVPEEGEEVSYELMGELFSSEPNYSKVKGLIYRNQDGQYIDTGKRELIENINQIPYPDYSQFPLNEYVSPCIPILGSRGCIFSCTFCSETVLWKRFRFRTGSNLVEEFKHHLEHFRHCNYFYITDSLINGNMKELIKMCELIIEEDLKVHWGGKVAIRIQMTKEVLELMHKAGCTNLQYGIESGSPKVIREMRKGFTVPIAQRVLRDTHNAGIKVGCFFLVGFPTETEKDYNETKNFIKSVEPYLDEIIPGMGMGLLPGSEVHDNPEVLKRRVADFRKFCSELDVSIGG